MVHAAVLIIGIIAALAAGGAIGVFIGIKLRQNTAEKEIGSAEEEAKRIVSDAIKTAEAKKKELVLEGKDEVHRFRSESEKENKLVLITLRVHLFPSRTQKLSSMVPKIVDW